MRSERAASRRRLINKGRSLACSKTHPANCLEANLQRQLTVSGQHSMYTMGFPGKNKKE